MKFLRRLFCPHPKPWQPYRAVLDGFLVSGATEYRCSRCNKRMMVVT